MSIGIGYFFVNMIIHITATITYHIHVANLSSPLNYIRKKELLFLPTFSVVYENKAAVANVVLFSCQPPNDVLGVPLLRISL